MVEHRVNRAVVFNSSLVHTSDVGAGGIAAGCPYANRRMNLTMLFGERQRGGAG